MTDINTVPAHLLEYRKFLVSAEQKAQEDFDKTVLALSGGALGVSFTFLKEVIGTNSIASPGFLLGSWISWGLSTFCILASYYLSHLALRQAIDQVDDGTIYLQTPGGGFSSWTARLNAAGGVLFLTGVISITVFAGINLTQKGSTNVSSSASATGPGPAPASVSPTSKSSAVGTRLHSDPPATPAVARTLNK